MPRAVTLIRSATLSGVAEYAYAATAVEIEAVAAVLD